MKRTQGDNNRSVTKFVIKNERITYGLNAHDKERRVFVDAWYGIKRFSVSVNPTGDRPWMGEKNPDGVEGDGEEMSE